jgi:hypothetical protein
MSVSTLEKAKVESVLTYRLVTSICKSHGAEGSVVYGVEITESGHPNNYSVINDLSANKYEAEEFVFRLKQGQVTPDQLLYIAEDFLVEISTRD